MRVVVVAAAFLGCISASAQVGGWLKPVFRSTARPAVGSAKQGLWTASLCNDDPVQREFQRERVTNEAPAIPFEPHPLAADLYTRAASRDVRSLVGSQGDTLLGMSGGITGAVGWAKGSKVMAGVAVGIDLTRFVFRILAKDAPNPGPYIAMLMPEKVILPAGQCGTWALVSGLFHDPQPLHITIHFPSGK